MAINPYPSVRELRSEAVAASASADAAGWHLTDDARDLLALHDDLSAIERSHPALDEAVCRIYEDLEAMRGAAIEADCDVDFGDDDEAADWHRERVEDSAISVDAALRLTRDAAVAAMFKVAA